MERNYAAAGVVQRHRWLGADHGLRPLRLADYVVQRHDANGQVVTIANDTTSGVFTSTLSANVAAGTYYLIVRSSGGYGNVGQYTLTGTVVPGVVTAPEISILFNGADLASGGSVSFGSTLVGSPVVQTFTVQNLGNGDLTLT